MTTTKTHTAQIYSFTPKRRPGGQNGSATVTALPVVRRPLIMPESGWYHDVAMRSEEAPRR